MEKGKSDQISSLSQNKKFQFSWGRKAFASCIEIHLVNCYSYCNVHHDLVSQYVLSDVLKFLIIIVLAISLCIWILPYALKK